MVDRFTVAAEAVGTVIKRFSTIDSAVAYVRELSGGKPISASYLPPRVENSFGATPFADAAGMRDAYICVSFAQAGVAETGSLLLELTDPVARSATALPVIHAVFLEPSSIVPDIYALQERLASLLSSPHPAYFSITTGPSRTADIERVLTIGVHGAKELHVLILEGE